MWIVVFLILLSVFVWCMPLGSCPSTHCEYVHTPRLARPAIHHTPFRYPLDTNNSDRQNREIEIILP